MLNELSKRDGEWRLIALKIAKDKEIANEITQMMYLKIDKYYKGNEEIKPFYVFRALKSCFVEYLNSINQFSGNEINDIEDDDDSKHLNEYDNLLDKLEKEVEKLYWYDREILHIKNGKTIRDENGKIIDVKNGKPFRQIESETNISVHSLFNTVKQKKEYLKEKLKEEYEKWQQKKQE